MPIQTLPSLAFAAKHGDIDSVRAILLRDGSAGKEVLARAINQQHTGLSALHIAIANGHEEVARELLIAGINPDLPDKNGATALHYCAEVDWDELIEFLFEKGANLETPKTTNGYTALMVAVSRKNSNSVEKLVSLGASLRAMSFDGYSALHLAAAKDSADLLRLMLNTMCERHATLEGFAKKSLTLMEPIAQEDSSEHVHRALLMGANVRDTNKYGWSALHLAVFHGHTHVAEMLIVQHALDAHQASADGYSPMHIAVWKQDAVALRMLGSATMRRHAAGAGLDRQYKLLGKYDGSKVLEEYKKGVRGELRVISGRDDAKGEHPPNPCVALRELSKKLRDVNARMCAVHLASAMGSLDSIKKMAPDILEEADIPESLKYSAMEDHVTTSNIVQGPELGSATVKDGIPPLPLTKPGALPEIPETGANSHLTPLNNKPTPGGGVTDATRALSKQLSLMQQGQQPVEEEDEDGDDDGAQAPEEEIVYIPEQWPPLGATVDATVNSGALEPLLSPYGEAGWTLLHTATYWGQGHILQALMQSGAYIHTPCAAGYTTMQMLKWRQEGVEPEWPKLRYSVKQLVEMCIRDVLSLAAWRDSNRPPVLPGAPKCPNPTKRPGEKSIVDLVVGTAGEEDVAELRTLLMAAKRYSPKTNEWVSTGWNGSTGMRVINGPALENLLTAIIRALRDIGADEAAQKKGYSASQAAYSSADPGNPATPSIPMRPDLPMMTALTPSGSGLDEDKGAKVLVPLVLGRLAQAGWFGLRIAHRDTVAADIINTVVAQSFEEREGEAALHYYVRTSYVKGVHRELAANISPNIRQRNGWAPLHYAAHAGDTSMVAELLSAGANPKLRNLDGLTAAQLAAVTQGSTEGTPGWAVLDLISQVSKESIEALAANGWLDLQARVANGYARAKVTLGGVNAVREANKFTPLHTAAWFGSAGAAAQLVRDGADVAVFDKAGQTPLHLAALKDKADVIHALASGGHGVNVLSRDGNLPLHAAAVVGACAAANALLEHGADVFAMSSSGQTALHLAVEVTQLDVMQTLVEGGMPTDLRARDGSTPLHFAVASSNIPAAVKLFELGAGEAVQDVHGLTALQVAVKNNNAPMVRALLGVGMSPDTPGNRGNTALHVAAWQCSQGAAGLLLEAGANVLSMNMDKLQPKMVCAMNDELPETVRRNMLEFLEGFKKGMDTSHVGSTGAPTSHPETYVWLNSARKVTASLPP